jgi:prepilin-type N-terminal cleavage/methylation domain-containing protein
MNRNRSRHHAFTLLELMLVVAILGIVLAIGLPSIYHMVNKEAMVGAVRDITDLCRNARARAVFKAATVEMHIHPREGRIEISGGGLVPGAEGSYTQTSAQLSDRLLIEMLDVNFIEYKDADEAVVKFYENGTSDEFTIVLHGDNGQYRKITLEVVTGLAEVQTL